MDEFLGFLNKSLNFRRFFAFSVFIFPLAITLNLLPGTVIPELEKAKIVFFIFSYFIFAGLNWIWSRKKLNFTLILLSVILGIPWLAFCLNGFDGSKSMNLFAATILYLFMLPIFLAAQFTAWIPSIVKYYSVQSKLNPVFVVVIVCMAIFGYIGLSIITQVIVESPGF